MQKKRNTISISADDYLLGSFCLLGMVAALFMFWNDLNISFAKANEPKIAVIYFKHNTAQRRLRDKNVWERLQQSSTIYNGDRIRTAADSEAYTIFNDGTRIDIHENTLIQVFDSKKGNNVNFIDGAISVKSVAKAPAITIHTGGKAISLEENTTATLNTAVANQITAIVSTGAINVVELQPIKPKVELDLFSILNSKAPEPQTLEATSFKEPINLVSTSNPQVKITAGNAITFSVNQETSTPVAEQIIEKPEVYLPTKTYSLMHDVNEIPFLPITWKSSIPMIMIFSRTSSFSEIIGKRELPADKTNLILQLDFANPEDTIYWQTISANNQNENTIEQYQSGVININLLQNEQMKESVKQAFGLEQAEIIQKQIIDADMQMNKTLLETQKQTELAQETNVVPIEQELPENASVTEVVAIPVPEEQIESTALVTEAVTEPIAETIPEPVPIEQTTTTAVVTEAVATTVAETIPEPVITPEPVAEPEPIIQMPAIISITPVLTAPAKDKKFVEADFNTDNPQIEFTWDEIVDAQAYIFTLYNGEKELKTIEVETPVFILKDEDLSLIDNGKFKWCVTAKQTVEETEYKSILAESTFEVVLSTIGDIEIDRSTLLNVE